MSWVPAVALGVGLAQLSRPPRWASEEAHGASVRQKSPLCHLIIAAWLCRVIYSQAPVSLSIQWAGHVQILTWFL